MNRILLGSDRKFVLASNNAHKISEIRNMLMPLGIELVSMKEAGIFDEIEENGTSFEENARIKARHIFDRYGLQAIADDSGLEVFALGGEPGVYSARYAGEEKSDQKNNELLLERLHEHEQGSRTDRRARFVCVICMVFRNQEGEVEEKFFRGTVDGMIIDRPRGEYGFGYDPLFEMNGRTMAELTEEEKNRISHRSHAVRELVLAMVRRESVGGMHR